MMRLIFARHGESQANVEQIISNRDLPHPLTAKGRQQASALADRLAENQIVVIYSSPILRAQETAQIIAQRLGLAVETSVALREFDCGVAEGRGDDEAWRLHNQVVQAWDEMLNYDQRIEGGESFNDIQARFVPFIEGLLVDQGGSDADILCISHGAVLSQMLPLVLANVDREFTTGHGLGNCTSVVATFADGRLICTEWDGLPLDRPRDL